MLFKNIHFILVRPQLGENIGAAARSLKNFNFENLRLISPRDSWPNKSATYTAVEAKDIIHKAKVFLNTDQAVADLDCVFAKIKVSGSNNEKIKYLFSEDQARYLIEINKKNFEKVKKIAKNKSIKIDIIGETQSEIFEIENNFKISVKELKTKNESWFKNYNKN